MKFLDTCELSETFYSFVGSANEQFTILNKLGLKTSLTGKEATGQVSSMMGSKEQAEIFLSLLEQKVMEVTKKPELWNYTEGSPKSPEEAVWAHFSGLWNQYS